MGLQLLIRTVFKLLRYIYIILAKTKTNIMNNLTVVILSYLLQRTIVHPIALIMTKVLVT